MAARTLAEAVERWTVDIGPEALTAAERRRVGAERERQLAERRGYEPSLCMMLNEAGRPRWC